MYKWDAKTENLMKAILALRKIDEAKMFFRDLMTEKELAEFGNRWKAAKMLYSNLPYSEIRKEIGLSSRTIARVAKWLDQGSGGYRLILEKTSKHHRISSFGKEAF